VSDQSAISRLLEEVRAGLRRVTAQEAAEVAARGGLLVDMRPSEQRRRHGAIPGAIVVERNVLEWRLDPTSPHRLPDVGGSDTEVVVICQEGYASSLAAASLRSLGLHRATDLDGGFVAWAAAGRPVEAGAAGPPDQSPHEVAAGNADDPPG
jgi:rhodanese-related sulfurtransferase